MTDLSSSNGFQSHPALAGNGVSQNSTQAITEADVLITEVLASRPARQPDLAAENKALHILAQHLIDEPQSMLKTLVRIALDLCRADTVGVSLLETAPSGESIFRWVAIAGRLASLEQTTTPGSFSPCGTTLSCNQPQLYAYPERYFTYLHYPQSPIVEGLLFPLYVDDQQLGTIWIVSHDQQRRFDREDYRLMTSFAGFTAAALQSIHLRQTAELALQREQAARLKTEAACLALDEAAQRQSIFKESITDAFVCLDHEWRITYVNTEAARLNNLQPEEMIGKSQWEIWSWSVGTIIEQTYRQVVADQVAAHFEVLHEPLKMWLEIRAYPAPAGLSIYFRDITKRKLAEDALRESVEFNRSVFESSADCIKVLDLNGCLLSMNGPGRCVMEIEDCTPLVGTSWFEFWQDSERANADNAVKTALSGGTGRFSGYCPTPKGTPKWWDVVVTPILDVLGKPKQLLVVSRDITDRKQAEAALRDSEEKFRNMANNAPIMVWVTDSSGYCTYLSQSWYDFTGQTEETGLGFGWMDVTHPEDQEDAKTVFLVANERREAFRLEYRLRRKDGEYCWVIDAASPWLGVDGRFKGYIGSVIDITDRKHAEAEREQLLAREQVAREEAEAANRIKDEFLAVLSHELRSPLNPILGWSSLLQSRKLDEAKRAQALATIQRNAKLQSELIEDLLDVSRILQGKLSLNVVPVNLAATIQAAMETVRLAAEAKSIQVQAVLEPTVGQVSGDSTRLQQVVWNLLSNAIKFTPVGGQINIRLEHTGSHAQITVSDTGKGIHPDFLHYVFDYFRQADATSTRKFGGLGLGLAIVRHLVELHGGTVEVESPGEEQGATFTVRLPLMSAQPITDQDSKPLEKSLDLNGIKILVVDDDTDTREFIAFVLEQYGARVTAVTSAAEALVVFTQSKPDVLLSDIGMPDVDGYMLIQKIRISLPQGGQIPAIALTAYAGEVNQKQALAAGFQKHISKPIEPEVLVQAISSLVRST